MRTKMPDVMLRALFLCFVLLGVCRFTLLNSPAAVVQGQEEIQEWWRECVWFGSEFREMPDSRSDRALSKALAEHDWETFVKGIGGLTDETRAELLKRDETTIIQSGLRSLYMLCNDESVEYVFAARSVFSFRLAGVPVTFCGVTKEGWLRRAGGLWAEWDGRRDDPGRAAAVAADVPQRDFVLHTSVTLLDGFDQAGGIAMVEVSVNRPMPMLIPLTDPDLRDTSDLEALKLGFGDTEEAFAIDGREALARPKAKAAYSYMGFLNGKYDRLLYDAYCGPRRFQAACASLALLGVEWPRYVEDDAEWEALTEMLKHWSNIPNGDDRIAFLFKVFGSDAPMFLHHLAFEALEKAGLQYKRLTEKDIALLSKAVRSEHCDEALRELMLDEVLPRHATDLAEDLVFLARSRWSAETTRGWVAWLRRDGYGKTPEEKAVLKRLEDAVPE